MLIPLLLLATARLASGLHLLGGAKIPGGPEEAAVYIYEAQGDARRREAAEARPEPLWSRVELDLHHTPLKPPRAVGEHGHELGQGEAGGASFGALGKQLAVPVAALVVGGFMAALPRFKVLSQLCMFFGAQTFMNIYMKAILSNSVISRELHMKGFQGPMLLTAVQQLISFGILLVIMGALNCTSYKYRPRGISSFQDVVTIFCLAVSFAANIALNNFSLSLLDMSVNVMIRSTSPLSTLLLQVLFARWMDAANIDVQPAKLFFMTCGVCCAVLVVLSKGHSITVMGAEHHFTLGIVLCVASLLASSLELIIVVIIGKGMKMNSIDTVLYMALPVVVVLLLPIFLIKHPVAYPHHTATTDWHVFVEVCRLNASTVVLVFLSGLFALAYNLLLYTMVKDLSPFFAAFAANFNKVVAIGLALFFGLERLPHGTWGFLMVLGVLGNMFAFTTYSMWPKSGAGPGPAKGKA